MRATFLGSNPLTILLRCKCGRRLYFNKKTWESLGFLGCEDCGSRICYKNMRVIPTLGGKFYMTVSEVAAQYDFRRTEGREKLIEAFDRLITALVERAALHRQHENPELLDKVLDIAQRTMLDLEELCRKWVDADLKGLTY